MGSRSYHFVEGAGSSSVCRQTRRHNAGYSGYGQYGAYGGYPGAAAPGGGYAGYSWLRHITDSPMLRKTRSSHHLGTEPEDDDKGADREPLSLSVPIY